MQRDELERSVSFLVDTYRELYMGRYHRPPLPEQVGQAILRGLITRIGLKQSIALLTEFFSQNGDKDWYVRQGHSAECFVKNIGALNASVGSKEKKVAVQQNILMKVESQCPKCQKYFFLVVDKEGYENKTNFTLCPGCST